MREKAQSHLASAQHSAQAWESALEAAKEETLARLEELKEDQNA